MWHYKTTLNQVSGNIAFKGSIGFEINTFEIPEANEFLPVNFPRRNTELIKSLISIIDIAVNSKSNHKIQKPFNFPRNVTLGKQAHFTVMAAAKYLLGSMRINRIMKVETISKDSNMWSKLSSCKITDDAWKCLYGARADSSLWKIAENEETKRADSNEAILFPGLSNFTDIFKILGSYTAADITRVDYSENTSADVNVTSKCSPYRPNLRTAGKSPHIPSSSSSTRFFSNRLNSSGSSFASPCSSSKPNPNSLTNSNRDIPDLFKNIPLNMTVYELAYQIWTARNQYWTRYSSLPLFITGAAAKIMVPDIYHDSEKVVFVRHVPTTSPLNVSVHIRMGDACDYVMDKKRPYSGNFWQTGYRNRPCFSFDVYLRELNRLRSLYGVHTVLLATDSETVLKRALNVTDYNWVYVRSEIRSKYEYGHAYIETRDDLTTEMIDLSLYDMWLLRQGHLFIGNMFSHFSRYVYISMIGELGYIPPFIAVDGGGILWYNHRHLSTTDALLKTANR